tara:strand:+ start:3474 stop:5489 length:2016 start_codon:yes stop_codon:yes gene_type:complete
MNEKLIPPVSASFIWSPLDEETVLHVIQAIRHSFARDMDKPFSRGLNIPLFFFSSNNLSNTPSDYPDEIAKNNIIFVFTSANTLGVPIWKNYIENIPNSEKIRIIPVAIDSYGLRHTGSISKLNCIRLYEWPAHNIDLYSVLFLAHELYRSSSSTFKQSGPGKNSSIKLFLSHAKSGEIGVHHSDAVKQFLDNTNMSRFFDATEISPGFKFDTEIEQAICQSTLIAIISDAYSSRYWCQREVLSAKLNDRPIVVVNCLDDYEDRIFPAASNVPCVHVSPEQPLADRDILRILCSAILETIRHINTIEVLNLYQDNGWIDKECEVTSRPPEVRKALILKQQGINNICYPDPPIYPNEADWHQMVGIYAFTPLWSSFDQDSLSGVKVGISISEVENDFYACNHMHPDSLIRLSQDLARFLLSRSATLIYGGDLRPSGFTEFILDEATVLLDRVFYTKPHIENHLAWPLCIPNQELITWRARYNQVMDTIEHGIPNDITIDFPTDTFLQPNTTKNSYIWSRCLTEMRVNSISDSSARICAGGKLSGYKGKMPGVLEEIILSISDKKPLFLIGAFGGVTLEVCKTILRKNITDPLTEEWQLSMNSGYQELQDIAHTTGYGCDYDLIASDILSVSIHDLSSRAGLNNSDYQRLMTSPFVDECVFIVLKGLKNISEK